jgi:hypothetical protein
MQAKLIKYGHIKYDIIKPQIEEIGYPFQTFGKNILKLPTLPYSLHTEYSASALSEQTIKELEKLGFIHLSQSLKSGRADLWYSKEWTNEFIDFIKYIVINRLDNKSPKIIEIHPPYAIKKDYQSAIKNFFENYKIFEFEMKKSYGDNLIILIENRNQSGNFLLSKSSDYISFQKYINQNQLDLKLIVDIPQLYGKMIRSFKKLSSKELIKIMIDDLLNCTNTIGGFHICGKGHRGDFDDLFGEDKQYFLEGLKKITDNIKHTVYVVPEIMKQQDFDNIMVDIQDYEIFNFTYS